MKYIQGFRNAAAAAALRRRIEAAGAALADGGRTASIMEVCGTHTMAIARHGIRGMLPRNVDLVSGPGCPVCVTDPGYIDAALALARQGATLYTFGDMLDVPGSDDTLAGCRAAGGRVEVVYGPKAALEAARREPEREIVFLAIGFETTIAPVIGAVAQAAAARLSNISLLTAFKRVPPALAALAADDELNIDAFICPAHVSAIIGARAYEPFCGDGGLPCVIAVFEPLDILFGIEGILNQLVAGQARVENQYSRVVRPDGNRKAQALIDRFLTPVDAHWRGLGTLPASGLGLRPEYAAFDAEKKHGIAVQPGRAPAGCLCGDVIRGKNKPPDCPLFGTGCTPDDPVGPCMVSAEGSCAAYYKYLR